MRPNMLAPFVRGGHRALHSHGQNAATPVILTAVPLILQAKQAQHQVRRKHAPAHPRFNTALPTVHSHIMPRGHLMEMGKRHVSVAASDVKKGQVIQYRGSKCVVVKTAVNVTNRKAFALLDLRDMKTGSTKQEKLRSDEKVEKVFVSNIKVIFLYEEGDELVFQDPETFDNINVPRKLLEGFEKFLSEGVEGQVVVDEGGEILSFLPPRKLTGTVEELGGGGGKIATLDIGISVQVPPFIQPGDRIIVDMEEQKYLSRATELEEE